MKNLICIYLLSSLIFSCKKDEQNQQQIDEEIIQNFISENNLNAKSTESGLYYVIENEGNGERPKNLNTEVRVAYTGYLTDSTVFDNTASNGARFFLHSVIEGWQEGIPKFREGGEGTLLVPSHLGYGSEARGKIPANSVLIFDIELKEVF